jgi:hypothetical protein
MPPKEKSHLFPASNNIEEECKSGRKLISSERDQNSAISPSDFAQE